MSTASAEGNRRFVRRLLLGAGGCLAAAAGALIAVGCFLGLYVRPTSDDWCAAWKSRDLGVLGITHDFYATQNGRITNAFLSGIVYGDGLAGVKILPTVIAVTFTAGLVLLGIQFFRYLGERPRVMFLIAAALALQALLYYGGTRTYQVLLWAPATISHTVPAVIGAWALLLAIRTVRRPRGAPRTAGFAAAFAIGFAIGTLSESFALVSGLLAAAIALLALPGLKLARTWLPFTWCLLWCAGLVVGLAVLYTSPVPAGAGPSSRPRSRCSPRPNSGAPSRTGSSCGTPSAASGPTSAPSPSVSCWAWRQGSVRPGPRHRRCAGAGSRAGPSRGGC